MSLTLNELRKALEDKKTFLIPIKNQGSDLVIDIDWQLYSITIVNTETTPVAIVDNYEYGSENKPGNNTVSYSYPVVEQNGVKYIQVDHTFLRKRISGIDFKTHFRRSLEEALLEEIQKGAVLVNF